jgi:hypothetical protein
MRWPNPTQAQSNIIVAGMFITYNGVKLSIKTYSKSREDTWVQREPKPIVPPASRYSDPTGIPKDPRGPEMKFSIKDFFDSNYVEYLNLEEPFLSFSNLNPTTFLLIVCLLFIWNMLRDKRSNLSGAFFNWIQVYTNKSKW